MLDQNQMDKIKKGYFLDGSKEECCLLIHGFGGTPLELYLLAEDLASRGYSVSAILLKGHNATLEEMAKCSYQDWIDTAEAEYKRLKGKYKKVYVIGLSMGAVIASILAERHAVDKLVLLCPPFSYKHKSNWLANIMQVFVKKMSWGKLTLADGNEKYVQGGTSFPVRSAAQMNKMIRLADGSLSQIQCPALLVYSKADQFVGPRTVKLFLKRVSSEDKEVFTLEKSNHIVVLDSERFYVFEAVGKFLKKAVGLSQAKLPRD